MRTLLLTTFIGLAASLIFSLPAKSENASSGIPLIRKQMKEWSRSGGGKNPWQLTTADTLACQAARESYTFEEALGDGDLHLEWRFTPTATNAKKAVAGSVTVRGTNSGQDCKIALGTDCGTITNTVVASSDRLKPFESKALGAKPKPIGDWNTLDIKLDGKTVSVSVNGVPVSSVGNLAHPSGVFSVNAEGDPIEFRNIRWAAR